jgi:hypothetical protein
MTKWQAASAVLGSPGLGQDLSAQVQALVADRASWLNLPARRPRKPAGDQEHPLPGLLVARTAPDLQPDGSSRISPPPGSRPPARPPRPCTSQITTPVGAGRTEQGGKQKAGPGPRDSPHPCRTYGVARPAERLDSTALDRRSLIRMRSQVQVLAGPPQRHDQRKRWSSSRSEQRCSTGFFR